jgi:hypothetical protein
MSAFWDLTAVFIRAQPQGIFPAVADGLQKIKAREDA